MSVATPLYIITSGLSIMLSVAAIVISVIYTNGGTGSTNTTIIAPVLLQTLISLYSNTTQPIDGPNVWTTIQFNNNPFTPNTNYSAWLWDGNSRLTCNRTGLSSIYLSVQVMANISVLPPDQIPFSCRSCQLKYQIRGVLQSNGTGPLNEIPTSLSYQSGQSSFLSKTFFVNATAGDVLLLQFVSLCSQIVLYPYPYMGNNLPQPNTYPSSTTLLITS
jgi:hypothetical protein